MKKLLIFLFIVGVIIVLIHVGLYFYINTKGKDLLIKAIREKFNAQAQVDSLLLRTPFTLEINNFRCGDIAFQKAKVSFALANPFDFPLEFNNVFIEDLNLKVLKSAGGWSIEPFFPRISADGRKTVEEQKEEEKIQPESETAPASRELSFVVKHLHAKNAVITVETMDTKQQPMTIVFDKIDLRLYNVTLPQLSKFTVKAITSLRSPAGDRNMQDVLRFEGWVDYVNKSMDMTVDVDKFDYLAYQQYYPETWKPKNLNIQEAVLSLNTLMKSQNNDLTIDWVVWLDTIVFDEAQSDGSTSRMKILKSLVEFFQQGEQKPKYRFIYKTKMDNPWGFFASLLKDLRSTMPIGPAIIAEALIEKTKEGVTEGAGQVIDKTKEAIAIGAKGVKKITIDTAVGAIEATVGAVKDIVAPQAQEQQPTEQPPQQPEAGQ